MTTPESDKVKHQRMLTEREKTLKARRNEAVGSGLRERVKFERDWRKLQHDKRASEGDRRSEMQTKRDEAVEDAMDGFVHRVATERLKSNHGTPEKSEVNRTQTNLGGDPRPRHEADRGGGKGGGASGTPIEFYTWIDNEIGRVKLYAAGPVEVI